MKLSQARREAVAALMNAGIDGAARDVDRLIAAILEVEPGRLRIMDDRDLSETEERSVRLAIEARASRQPVAQIVGFRDFYAHRFRVTRDTLDPRPETETLIEAALRLNWRSVLDMGTGSGAILISLLAARPGATGLGSDVSCGALEVARENAAVIGVRASFCSADWYDGIESRFDLIVSNPPYIALDEMAGLSADVLDWEPHSALTDGGDGLSAYRAIAAGMTQHLNPEGNLLVEIGHRQGGDVSALFQACGAKTRVIKDLDGRDRVIHAWFPA